MVIAAVLAACSPRDRRTPDDTLVMLVDGKMSTADPRHTVTNYDSKLARLVFAGLTALDTPDNQPRLALASKVTYVDDVTVDFELRDATFSDGWPVTADDVAKTYMSVLQDESSSAHKQLLDRIVTVEAVGPKTARFHLRDKLATLMADVDFGILAFHDGVDGLVGAGPYVLRDLTSYKVELDANPHYYGAAPKVAHVEMLSVTDAAARIVMMVGGSADLVQNGVRLDLVDEIAQRDRVRVESSPSVLLTYLMMNNEDAMLKDVRVRRAVALALDRPAIIAADFQGRAVLATGLIAPSHPMYNGDVPRYDRDLATANALLDAAGYPRKENGMRAHLTYKTSSDAFRVTIARQLAAQLREVGLDVEVRPFEFATFFADIKKGNFELASMQTSEITDPDYYWSYFNSVRIPTDVDRDAPNRWRYRNDDVDRLTVAGRHELDPAKRRAIYDEVQRLVARDLPIVPLWHEDNVLLSNASVSGYTMIPNARFGGLVTATKQSW